MVSGVNCIYIIHLHSLLQTPCKENPSLESVPDYLNVFGTPEIIMIDKLFTGKSEEFKLEVRNV